MYPGFRKKAAIAILIGSVVGTIRGQQKAKRDNKYYEMPTKLVEYQCEDQINKLIDETQKPCIIYYYLPKQISFMFIRHFMIKYSQLYSEQCHWVMVNLMTHFALITQGLNLTYPNNTIYLQIRYPKGLISQEDRANNEYIEYKGYRRHVYPLNLVEQDFRDFLKMHGIIKENPLQDVLKITRQALFDPIPKLPSRHLENDNTLPLYSLL